MDVGHRIPVGAKGAAALHDVRKLWTLIRREGCHPLAKQCGGFLAAPARSDHALQPAPCRHRVAPDRSYIWPAREPPAHARPLRESPDLLRWRVHRRIPRASGPAFDEALMFTG